MSSTMSYETTLKAKASTPSDSFAASEVEYATSEKSALMSNSLMVKDLQPDFVAFSLNWGTVCRNRREAPPRLFRGSRFEAQV